MVSPERSQNPAPALTVCVLRGNRERVVGPINVDWSQETGLGVSGVREAVKGPQVGEEGRITS